MGIQQISSNDLNRIYIELRTINSGCGWPLFGYSAGRY
jgi:hypothetical protein